MNERKSQKLPQYFFLLIAVVGIVYFFSNPKPQNYYDYTFRVAENFLRGAIGFAEKPPPWLNEFVPFEGNWYSVFPLGSVLTMIPFSFFKTIGAVREMPSALIAALTASGVCFFLLKIADYYEHEIARKILIVCGILFGTWMWTNETLGGAWQLALGFAMLGTLGAIYFTVYKRRPILAGLFFALAFGNRTEILLTAPVFMFLLVRNGEEEKRRRGEEEKSESEISNRQSQSSEVKKLKIEEQSPKTKNQKPKTKDQRPKTKKRIFSLARFCIIPFILGVSTLVYNYLRFDSFTDFGYARIPGVLSEPWYQHGIFSVYYIPDQAYQMLFKPWRGKPEFPFLVPDGFSASILWSSPFLLFAFRCGARDKFLKYASWAAIIVLTFLLWLHGNAGGWQFGYRYAMVLLPWIFVILLENSPKKITAPEWFAYAAAILLNLYATYLFHWTNYVKI